MASVTIRYITDRQPRVALSIVTALCVLGLLGGCSGGSSSVQTTKDGAVCRKSNTQPIPDGVEVIDAPYTVTLSDGVHKGHLSLPIDGGPGVVTIADPNGATFTQVVRAMKEGGEVVLRVGDGDAGSLSTLRFSGSKLGRARFGLRLDPSGRFSLPTHRRPT
jgi:hypothetical protein